MPTDQRDTLLSVCAVVIITLTICAVSGCAQPTVVRVIESSTGAPVSGARVTRLTLERPPLWVVGPIVPAEQCETDDHGLAHLKDCDGVIEVDADGFNLASSLASSGLDDNGKEVVISLTRVDEKSQQIDASGN